MNAANDTTPDDPTAADPFAGLRLIPKLAIKGSDEYVRLASEAVTYTWEAVAMPGIVIGIAGAPGEGKTTLMFLLAVARGVTDGAIVRVLDLEVAPAPPNHWIVIVEAEHGRNSAARKLVKSAHALGLEPPRCLERVITIPRSKVVLGSPEWKEIERMIEAGIVADVFVDSLARFAPADANDEKEQAKIFATIAVAIERSRGTQPTFWIVMHSRKGARTGNTEAISGSTQRGGQIDSEVECTAVKDEQLRVRHVEVTFPKLREEPDEHPGKRAFAVERIDGAWRYRDVTDDEIAAAKEEQREQRKTARADKKANEQADDVAAVFEVASRQPGIKTRDLLAAVRFRRGAGKERAEAALLAAKMQRRVETKPGPHKSQLVFPCCA